MKTNKNLIRDLLSFAYSDFEDSIDYERLKTEWKIKDPYSENTQCVIWAIEEFVRQKIGNILCKNLGHSPVKDHCGISEHDYCEYCKKNMPGAVSR